jgi:methyl-accepting chemotaxis protein
LVLGPIKRLRWAVDKVKEGDLSFKVTLRQGDFLIEEGDLFNLTIDSLAERINRVKSAAEFTATALKELEDVSHNLPDDSRSRVAGLVETLQGRFDDVQSYLSYFKTRVQTEDST